MEKKNNKNILIVCHRNLPQPDDDLVIYLNLKEFENVLHIKHSFSDAKDRRSFYFWYKKGAIYKTQKSPDFLFLPEPFIYLKEFLFTFFWIISTGIKWNKYIGMDGLLSAWGIVFKKLGIINNVIYWVMDLVPEGRFRSGIKNSIYNKVNKFSILKSDEVWDDLGEQRLITREKYFGIKRNDYKKHRVVPFGVWTDRIKTIPYDKCEKNTLVFMGHLVEKQGVQFVIKTIPEILKKIPDFKLKIIGSGNYQKKLKEIAKECGVQEQCIFYGKIEENERMEEEIAKSAVAIAPYIKELDKFSYYGDNGKVKVYLGCGVPVLLTNVSWLAKEIETRKAGKIIENTIESIYSSVLELLIPKINNLYRKNSKSLSLSFDYYKIFNEII